MYNITAIRKFGLDLFHVDFILTGEVVASSEFLSEALCNRWISKQIKLYTSLGLIKGASK